MHFSLLPQHELQTSRNLRINNFNYQDKKFKVVFCWLKHHDASGFSGSMQTSHSLGGVRYDDPGSQVQTSNSTGTP
jgi:hypothetical protein